MDLEKSEYLGLCIESPSGWRKEKTTCGSLTLFVLSLHFGNLALSRNSKKAASPQMQKKVILWFHIRLSYFILILELPRTNIYPKNCINVHTSNIFSPLFKPSCKKNVSLLKLLLCSTCFDGDKKSMTPTNKRTVATVWCHKGLFYLSFQ